MTPLKKELKAALSSPSLMIAWLLLTALVSYSGPFGTYQSLPLGERITFWGGVVAASVIAGVIVRVIVSKVTAGWSQWASSLVTAAVLSVVLTLPMTLFGRLVLSETPSQVPGAAQLMFLIFVLGAGINAIRSIRSGERAGPSSEPVAGKPKLLERVEPALRGRVIRASVCDHYVSLITEMGEARLLMRFADAIAELEGVAGMQVHRSHWVALDSVRDRLREKGRLFLCLEDGAVVPVSRNYLETVENTLGRG